MFSRAALESGGYSVWDAHGLNTSQKSFDRLATLLCPTLPLDDPALIHCLLEKDTATVAMMSQVCSCRLCQIASLLMVYSVVKVGLRSAKSRFPYLRSTCVLDPHVQLLPKPCNPEFCCKWAPVYALLVHRALSVMPVPVVVIASCVLSQVVDGTELPDHPYRLAAAGHVAPNIALLTGATKDEDASFIGQVLYCESLIQSSQSLFFLKARVLCIR